MPGDERFWQRVTRSDGCWVWQGRSSSTVDPQPAHRAAWFFTYGEWPLGEVKQACGNRLCVRPNTSNARWRLRLPSHCTQTTEMIKMPKRQVEVFTSGCPICDPAVQLVQELACPDW